MKSSDIYSKYAYIKKHKEKVRNTGTIPDSGLFSQTNELCSKKGGTEGNSSAITPPEMTPEKSLPVPVLVQGAINEVEKPAIREPGEDVQEQVAEVMYRLCGPLSYFDWFNLILAFWNFSEDYKTDWAGNWHSRIKAVDIDWIRRAMNATWAILKSEHQELLREEYRKWREHDKVFNWEEMAKGHEYIAVCSPAKNPETKLKRHVYAWSFAEAKKNFKSGTNEILLGWVKPGCGFMPESKDVNGEVPF
jgi:hypothetical protein